MKTMSRFPILAAVLFGKLTAIEALLHSDLDHTSQAEISALIRAANREQDRRVSFLSRNQLDVAKDVEGSASMGVVDAIGEM